MDTPADERNVDASARQGLAARFMVGVACAALLLAGAASGLGGGSSAQPPSSVGLDRDGAWAELRRQRPFHLQAIATSSADDGATTVIVAEPPPHAALATLESIAGASRSEVKRTRVGFDGWVSDVLLEVPAIAEAELDERLTELAGYLYGSSYRAHRLTLPLGPRDDLATPRAALDVQVGAEDLRRWLFDEGVVLEPELGGAARTAADLAANASEGLFRSVPGGLLLWAVPIGGGLQRHASECRRWLLDSDLVLGGIAGKSSLLIVGRARQIPVDVLPPLRTEEVLRLAAVATDELQQSYERNHPLAGRCAAGRKDWAPILLSGELIDTELGSLLNITDQLLKGWSQAGDTAYENFPYPPRDQYPFEKPLSNLIETSSLTFNWNTTGVGYEVAWPDGVRVFAVHRTGALPVSYIPEGADDSEAADAQALETARASEEQAYRWFALSRDVHLARVVQYTALYQMFRAFGVRAEPELDARVPTAGVEVLRVAVENALNRIRGSDDSAITALVRASAERYAGLLGEGQPEDQRTMLKLGLVLGGRECATALRDDMQAAVAEFGEAYVGELARLIAYGRPDDATMRVLAKAFATLGADGEQGWSEASFARLPRDERRACRAWAVREYLTSEGVACQVLLQHLADVPRLHVAYARAFQARPELWLRTPSIVLSSNTNNIEAIGGHNVSSKIPKVVVDATRARGKAIFESTADGMSVRLHPDDAAAMRGATRGIARSTTDEARRAAIAAARLELDQVGKRPMAQALQLSPGGPRDPLPPRALRLGAEPFDDGVGAGRNFVQRIDEREGGRLRVLDDATQLNGRRSFTARNRAGLVDAMHDLFQSELRAGRRAVEIELPSAWADGEVRGLMNALRAKVPSTTAIKVWQSSGDLRTVRLDFAKAEALQTSGAKLTPALDVDVPAVGGGGAKLRIRVELRLRQGATDVKALGRRVLDDFSGRNQPKVEDVVEPMRAEFLKDPDVERLFLQIRSQELGSITITDARSVDVDCDAERARRHAA